jgi:transcriptional regulator with XRE-family HTH domain
MRPITLLDARRRRRLDQVTLAKRSGLNQSTVSRLEQGAITKPSRETVQQLELALGLKPGRLVFGDQVSEARAS